MAADEPRRLYGLPLDRFTAERDALAKRLGDPEVRRLRKPPLSAWAVNQLVRERTPQLEDLWRAADRLRKAHGGKGDFARAAAAEREALGALVASAAELLRAAGHAASDATLARVRGTLAAGAADREVRKRVAEGMLAEDVAPPGFEALR